MSDSSSSKRPWIVLVVAMLAVGILVFWWAGRMASSTPKAEDATAPKSAAPASSASSGAGGVAAAADPRPALARALLVSDPRGRAKEFGQLMQDWIARDLEGALAYVRGLPHSTEYTQALLMVLEALGRRDPERALNLAGELATTREDRVVYNVLFDRFARDDVTAALSRLALVPAGEARENSLRALTDAWASTDSAAALAWGRTLADAGERRIVLESALLEVAQREPLQALEAAPRELEGAALERVVAVALRQLNESDPMRASAQLGALSAGTEAHTLAMIDIARAWAGRDGPAALAWVEKQPAGKTRDLTMGNLFQAWAWHDPDAAARRAAQLPAGGTLDRVAPLVAAALVQASVQSAIGWTTTLGSDSARAAATVAVASTWSQRDPASAIAWAAALPADATRDTAVINAYANWQLQNSAAAQAWLGTAALPPALKSRLQP